MTQPAYLDRLLGRLTGVRPQGDGWVACCPCPDHNGDGDQNASLRVAVGDDGRVLLKCRVGCPTDAVLAAVGLDWPDLFAPAGEEPAAAAASPSNPAGVAIAVDAGLIDRAYTLLLAQLPLEPEHRADLKRRGLPEAAIERNGYRTLRNAARGRAATAVHRELEEAVLGVPGFARGQFGVTLAGEATGLIVPVRDLAGRIRAIKIRRSGDPKYLYLSGGEGGSPGSQVHVPLGTPTSATTVRVTEGELKADACRALDELPTIGIPGVTQWNASICLLKEMGARTIVVAFDAPDVHSKPPVFEQLEAFSAALTAEGFTIELEDWDETERD